MGKRIKVPQSMAELGIVANDEVKEKVPMFSLLGSIAAPRIKRSRGSETF
jgi:hypothetical protein